MSHIEDNSLGTTLPLQDHFRLTGGFVQGKSDSANVQSMKSWIRSESSFAEQTFSIRTVGVGLSPFAAFLASSWNWLRGALRGAPNC